MKKHNEYIMYLQFLWLLIMMMIPAFFTKTKYILLIIVILLNLFNKGCTKSLGKRYLCGLSVFTLVALAGCFNSLFHFFELQLNLLEIYLLRPIILTLFVMNFNIEEKLQKLISALVIITSVIVTYDAIFILGALGILPKLIFWEKDSVVIINNGFIACRLSNYNALMFLLPMMFALINVYWNKQRKLKKFLYYNVLLGTLIVIFSGRRALQIVIILSIALNSFQALKNRYTQKNVLQIMSVGILGGTAALLLVNKLEMKLSVDSLLLAVIKTMVMAFQSLSDTGSVRALQIIALLNKWSLRPFLGWGLAAYAEDCIRSTSTPWSYEFSYLAYLMQLGIIGVGVYALIFAGIFYRFQKLGQTYRELSAIKHAMVMFFIAGASNPMIVAAWFWMPILAACNISEHISDSKNIYEIKNRNA